MTTTTTKQLKMYDKNEELRPVIQMTVFWVPDGETYDHNQTVDLGGWDIRGTLDNGDSADFVDVETAGASNATEVLVRAGEEYGYHVNGRDIIAASQDGAAAMWQPPYIRKDAE